ncbi:MAG: EAL domain-containing protein [Frankiaceae bacterium]|nr:EAL domain-containing protein [Frankiaceae bacterium]
MSTWTSEHVIPRQQDGSAGRGDRALVDALVVDDDPDMAGSIVEILQMHGMRAAAVTSATAAITSQRQLRPTVMVCDQRLPDMSGLDLCAAIRAIDPDVSLILLTGHASLDSAIAAVGHIDQYLVKPVAPAELVTAVQAGTERSAQRQADRAAAERMKQELEAQLRQQALHDSLTGLPNRTLFVQRAQHALDRRDRGPVVVCFLDLDDFKDVNDTYGHGAGDDLLCVVASRLRTCLRPADTVARFGGDEFAILLEDTDLVGALIIADRVRAATSLPVSIGDSEVMVRVSVGLAPCLDGSATPERLLAEADAAMYAAKSAGTQGVAVFEPSMRQASEARTRMRADIAQALANRDFRIEYQPIIGLGSDEIVGCEALIRWQHAQRGLLAPSEFIEHAEVSGQIAAIGEWVLRTACQEICERAGDGLLSVNLSGRQLQQADIVELVASALDESRLPPERLILEITETATVADTDLVITQLAAMKELGVRFALDDFGTGYASLRHLRRFPVSFLKIDRSFVRAITVSSADLAIVRGVIDIAHGLGLVAIAEGVEADEQRDLLKEIGCDMAQGFLWAPDPVADQN